MNEKPAAPPKPAAFSLEILKIRECTFSFRSFFGKPRSLASIQIPEIANAFLDTFREYNLSAADIVLEKGDGLFGYSLKAHLFNRLLSINVSAIAVESTFGRLLGAADRRLAADCIKKLVALFRDGLSEYCFFEAALHADFESSNEKDEFFSLNAEGGLDLGGVLAYKKLGEEQLIRVEIDQSWTLPNGAFIDFRAIGMKLEQFLSFDPIWGKFFELTEGFDLQLEDA